MRRSTALMGRDNLFGHFFHFDSLYLPNLKLELLFYQLPTFTKNQHIEKVSSLIYFHIHTI